ncbi:MAG: SUMF1/EgtB/PvdO family nonheme iron enzyme [Rubrivivax sp.]
MTLRAAALDDPVRMRHADRELLSLALMDARNLTLRWLDVYEARGLLDAGPGRAVAWLAGHAAWYQEWWIGRHPQRSRGEHADPAAPRLPSVQPRADDWFGRPDGGAPDATELRPYLADTLDTTLELLAGTADSDDTLHVYRAALLHEDRIGQALGERALMLQLTLQPDPPPPLPAPTARADREALYLPEAEVRLGSERGGFVPDNERWAHPVAVPAFEIDAQPVSWERFVEFADDGGYDQPGFWSDAGRRWLEASGRRAPRDVEQLRGGLLLQRMGQMQRAAPGQAAVHVTRHEAEAWCRWAGRRLPTEPEWELAAGGARHRGFVLGDVFEWVAGSARPWPGHAPTPGGLDAMPEPGTRGVLRGASRLTPPRWRHPKARRFAAFDDDTPPAGFRSCAP